MTRLLYLGQSGFVLEHRGIRLAMDPWFSPAFFQAWFPYPDNRFLLDRVAGRPLDFLYVSHLHEDHFDEETLKQIPRDVTVLCPDYRSGQLQRELRRLGFEKLLLLGHKERREIAPGTAASLFLDTSHKEDSGLLLELDGFRFLNLNDCAPPLGDIPTGVDLLAAQYSGAMWYPNCYDYPPDVMRRKNAEIGRSLKELLSAKCRMAQAKAYLPSGGPVCFLDPALRPYNNREETIFPLWEQVAEGFSASNPGVDVLRALPGDEILVKGGKPVLAPHAGSRPDSDIAAYSERRRAEWEAFHRMDRHLPTDEEVSAYFKDLVQRNRHLLEGYPGKTIRISSGAKEWAVEVGPENAGVKTGASHPQYTFRVPEQILRLLVSGAATWEHALASMRLGLHRDPDIYDSILMCLLRYGSRPAQTRRLAQDMRSREMIALGDVRIQRFCPHAGEDLTRAQVCGGVLTCPRHHWQWDIRTGECVSGGNLPLRVEKPGGKRG